MIGNLLEFWRILLHELVGWLTPCAEEDCAHA